MVLTFHRTREKPFLRRRSKRTSELVKRRRFLVLENPNSRCVLQPLQLHGLSRAPLSVLATYRVKPSLSSNPRRFRGRSAPIPGPFLPVQPETDEPHPVSTVVFGVDWNKYKKQHLLLRNPKIPNSKLSLARLLSGF
jgi:hypothetical protein